MNVWFDFTLITWYFLELIYDLSVPQNSSILYIGVYVFAGPFPLYSDGFDYPTFQLTDILGYSSM